MQHQKICLRNHLETLFVQMAGCQSASIQMWFRAGSALEEKADWGIAHFLEHMFFKGTPTRPGADIAHQAEGLGGELNAFTSFDYTCYYLNIPSKFLTEGLEILLDMVAHPSFKLKDFTPERGVVLEEYRRSQDNPGQFSFQKLQDAVFTGGYQHPILGYPNTISRFNRKQLIQFRKKFYNLSNALLIVAGDLNKKSSVPKLSQKIESFKFPKGPASTFPAFKLKKNPTVNIHEKDVKMAQLYICFQAPDFEDGHAAAEDLALSALGYGETSRLYKNLVLDGSLANSVSNSTMFMNRGGLHSLKINFPPENLTPILSKLESTLIQAMQTGLSEQEVQKIKNQYLASKVYDRESTESYAFSLGHSFAQTGSIHAENEFIERVKNTQTHTVNTKLKELLKENMHLSLQIPKGLKHKKQTLLLNQFQISLKKKAIATKNQSKGKYKASKSKYDSQTQLLQLKSGVQLIYRHNPVNPTFVLHAYLKGGLSSENILTHGSHHILGKTLTKGYLKIKYEKLKSDLENKSASLNGIAGRNSYGLALHGQSQHFGPLTEHFCGSLLHPNLPANRVKHEKEITLRQLKVRQVDPVKRCFEEAAKIFFNGHPYALPALGSAKSIHSIQSKHLRELHAKNLTKSNLLFTYCGDQSLDEVISALEPHYSQIGPRSPKKRNSPKIKYLSSQNVFIKFDREQTQIFYGIPVAELGHRENLYLKMLTAHLSGQSSELFVEVRDRKGLCYTAQPVHFSALEAGYWGIYMASGHDKVPAALKSIEDIIANIKAKGLQKNQFQRIKRMIQGQSLLAVQTNEDYANIYSATTLHGHPLDYYHLENKAVQDLSHRDFQTHIKTIFERPWSTILLGRSRRP